MHGGIPMQANRELNWDLMGWLQKMANIVFAGLPLHHYVILW
jgi:hypothetical protein